MTTIDETALAAPDEAGRLLNPVVKEPSTVKGRFVFRGEFAVEFAEVTEKEKKPPTILAQQVIASADAGRPHVSFFAAYLLSFEWLKPMHEALGPSLGPEGLYFAFCNNIELGESYCVPMGDVTWVVLPLDESSVWIELLEIVDLERRELKKLSGPGKVDAVVEAFAKWKPKYEKISYEEGLKRMGPVRDPGEHRPV